MGVESETKRRAAANQSGGAEGRNASPFHQNLRDETDTEGRVRTKEMSEL